MKLNIECLEPPFPDIDLDVDDQDYSGAFTAGGLAEYLCDKCRIAPDLGRVDNIYLTLITSHTSVLNCQIGDRPYIFKVRLGQ